MSDFESELRHAIKNGLLHLSLNKCWKGDDWEAGYRNTDNSLVDRVVHRDPVEALKAACRAGVRSAKKTAAPPAPEPEKKVHRRSEGSARRRDAEDLI